MNIQIFGKSKCFDTKKAERWFKEPALPLFGVKKLAFSKNLNVNGRYPLLSGHKIV